MRHTFCVTFRSFIGGSSCNSSSSSSSSSSINSVREKETGIEQEKKERKRIKEDINEGRYEER